MEVQLNFPMNYIDLYENAVYDLKNKTITLEEYDEIIKPLRKEVDSDIKELEKIKEEIENMWIKSAKDLRTGKTIYENLCEHSEVLEIIDNHIEELKGENK